MMDRAKTNLYVLATLAGLVALVLWWSLAREGAHEAGDDPAATASASGSATEDERPAVAVPLRGAAIDPWKAPRAAVSGTVRDEKGQPIAGAQVCGQLQDRDVFTGSTRYPPQCTSTRDDGSYRLDELLGASHDFNASARGYLPARYETRSGLQSRLESRVVLVAGSTRTGIDFVLKEGGVEVQGIVKDLAGGEIEGAWVSSGMSWRGSEGTAFARSDAEGRFSLWVEPPEVHVDATAEGYAQGSRSAAIPGSFVEIFLTPESVVIGKVVWAGSGKPVAGARVSTSSSPFGGTGVQSEDDGSFRLEGLEPGSYKIHASSDELVGMSAEKIHVGLGQTSELVVVEVSPAFAVRGSVVVDAKTPCSNATLRLQDRKRKAEGYGSGMGRDDGTILVRGVLPGTYEVTIMCSGFVSEDAYPDVVVADASLDGLTWTVHAGRAIRGVVLDAEGRPVEGANVSARGKAVADPRARLGRGWSERSEPDGSFVVDGLLPGTYELSANHERLPAPHEPTIIEVPEDQDVADVTLAMLASGEVHGIVRDEKGTAVAGVSVQLEGPSRSSASTNDDGRFVLQGLEVGEHRIKARRGRTDTMRAPGASDDDTAGERVEVRHGEITEVELVVESQGGRITGRVLGEGGEPVADAFVEAVRESDSAARSDGSNRRRARWGSWSRQPVLTDEEGRFELGDLAEQGTYAVHASRKGGGEAMVEHVQTGSDVELSIAETGVLAGVVRIEGGGSPQRFQISARDPVGGIYEGDGFLHTEGKWRLGNLPPGKFEISVEASEGNAKTEVELAEGAEATDIELILAPRVRLRGRLVDATTGDPIPGLKVSVSATGGFSFRGDMGKADQPDVSDARGNFVVEDAPTGKINLMVSSPGFTKSDYGRNMLARRVSTEAGEQDLGDIELYKERVDGGQEAGDLGFKLKEAEPGTEPEAVRHIVAYVRPGGPAEAAGLEMGHEITVVDGDEVTGTNAYRYRMLMRVSAGTVLRLGVVEDGKLRVLTLTAGPPV